MRRSLREGGVMGCGGVCGMCIFLAVLRALRMNGGMMIVAWDLKE